MDAISLIIQILLLSLTVVLAFLLTTAIIFNVKAGKRYRQGLAIKVDQLRLSKMLTALGIDINVYLHKERIVDIENQMKRCTECVNTDECDDKLANSAINADDIHFCNNEETLREIAKEEGSSSPAI